MNDKLIKAFLPPLMKTLAIEMSQQKQKSQFYHTHLLIAHLKQAKQLLNPKIVLNQLLIEYYQQFQPEAKYQRDQFEDLGNEELFRKEVYKQQEKDRLVFEIILYLLLLALKTQGQQSQRRAHTLNQSKIVGKCQDLQLLLTLQDLCISEVLQGFLSEILTHFRDLSLLQYLLGLFQPLNFYKLCENLESKIKQHRQKFDILGRTALSKRGNMSRINRRSSQFYKRKQSNSLVGNQNCIKKDTFTSVRKVQVQQKQIKRVEQTSQKEMALSKKQRRTTTFFTKKFQFTGRKTQANIFLGEEDTTFQNGQNQKYASQSEFYLRSRFQPRATDLNDLDEDALAENTPPRKLR